MDSTAVKPISLMNLLRLSFLNLGRHRLRAAINIIGITVAVAALIFFLSFYRGTYEGVMFASVINYATSHGQFMSASFDDDEPDVWLDSTNLFDQGLAQDANLVGAAMPGNTDWSPVVAPRLMSPAFAGSGSRQAAVTLAGVDFRKESELLAIDERMVAGGLSREGVVIGKKLADTLCLSLGDEIRVQANTVDGAPNLDYWQVAGIYSTGYPPMDRGIVMMDLSEAQEFLSAGMRINKLYCLLAEGTNSVARERRIAVLETERERSRIAGLGLVFRSWRNYAKAIVEDAEGDGLFFSIFIGILLFLSLSTMAGTMRVTVYERKREIGMLRASGWLKGEITRLFLFEALLIGVAVSSIGCLVGGFSSLALQLHPIEFGGMMEALDVPSFSLTCDLQPRDFLVSVVAGFLTAMLAGIMPARNGARLPILSAMAER